MFLFSPSDGKRSEHLSDGELLVERESFQLRGRDRDGTRRDACRLAVAYEDFVPLGYELLGRAACVWGDV